MGFMFPMDSPYVELFAHRLWRIQEAGLWKARSSFSILNPCPPEEFKSLGHEFARPVASERLRGKPAAHREYNGALPTSLPPQEKAAMPKACLLLTGVGQTRCLSSAVDPSVVFLMAL